MINPRPVPWVPNPWRDYMDGRIWEFSDQDLRQLPSIPRPQIDPQAGVPTGPVSIVWRVGSYTYVRFVDAEHLPNVDLTTGQDKP